MPETQKQKFERAAKELETNDSEESLDRLVKKIAKSPPPKDDKAKPEK